MLLPQPENLPHPTPTRHFSHSSFRHSNLIRHSSFVIRHSNSIHNSPRGTAEIELILIIPILLALLFLAKGSLGLGAARLQNGFQAEQTAYSDATTPTAAPADSASGNLAPTVGFVSDLPNLPDTLPNRMHVSTGTVNYTPAAHVPLNPITMTEQAAFASPAWAYSAWPAGNSGGFQDSTATDNWFSDYAAQVRDNTAITALGLSPSSPP
jgi:hypothetical protein